MQIKYIEGDIVRTLVNRKQMRIDWFVNGVWHAENKFMDYPVKLLLPFVTLGRNCEIEWISSFFHEL